MTPISAADRVTRFSSLVAPDVWAQHDVAIIGIGAIGRALALLISQLPIRSLTLVDDDKVGPENMGTQGYFPSDLTLAKVDQTRLECIKRNPLLRVHTLESRIDNLSVLTTPPTFVFLCVDSMSARTSISSSSTVPLIDCRMGSQTMNLAYRDPASPSAYEATLFPDSEALQEPCTGRSTPWCATAAAAMALNLWSIHLRDSVIPSHLTCNLFALEMFESVVPHAPALAE